MGSVSARLFTACTSVYRLKALLFRPLLNLQENLLRSIEEVHPICLCYMVSPPFSQAHISCSTRHIWGTDVLNRHQDDLSVLCLGAMRPLEHGLTNPIRFCASTDGRTALGLLTSVWATGAVDRALINLHYPLGWML